MDNAEFESRAFANPDDNSQDFLDAIIDNPQRMQLLQDIRSFDQRLGRAFNSIPVPGELADRVKTALAGVDEPGVEPQQSAHAWGVPRPARLLAMAAALILAVGITYSSLFSGSQPNAAELAFGQQVMDHVYLERVEVDASPGVNYQLVNEVIGTVGGRMPSDASVGELQIRFAKLCEIIPRFPGAHLVMEGDLGQINIILIKNSPVHAEFFMNDEHFDSLIVPVAEGNLILVGEKEEHLADYRQVLTNHLEWSI